MALTDTQAAKQSAVIAENAAAEAKSYAEKAEKGEDFSNQAKSSADAAALSEAYAADSASKASVSEENAASSAAAAEASSENAFLASNVYPSELAGQAAIDAGTIPLDALFNVVGSSGYAFVDQYKNLAGVATKTGNSYPNTDYVKSISDNQQFLLYSMPEILSNSVPDWLHAWVDKDNNMVGGFDLGGGLGLCGMPDTVQDRVSALADYLTSVRIPGYHDVVLDAQGKSGYAVRDDWSLLLAGLEKSVQDEINDLKTGGGSALLRPYNGLLAVFKDAVSTTPVYAVNPVAYASKLTVGGASIVYDDAGTTKTATLNLLEHPDYTVPPNNWVQRPIPLSVSAVLYRMGLGQSLMVGGGTRVTNVDSGLLGLALVFFGAGGDRGAGGSGFAEGAVTDSNLNVFKDAESIGNLRENCMVPGLQRFFNDLLSIYGISKSVLPAAVTRMDARSGTAYSGLKKGTQPYTDGITAFTTFVERVMAQGKIPKSHSIIITHGEKDSEIVTVLGQYKGYLNEWINDEQTDQLSILASHGVTQTEKPIAYVDQMGGIGKTATNRGDLITFDQLSISNDRVDVVCTCPAFPLNRKYPLDNTAGQVHLLGVGYAIKGEYQGQAEAFMYKERLAGTNKKWTPVQPVSVVKNGLDYDVTFPSPLGLPLKINTKYGTAPNLGVDLENGSATVISASQVSDFVFRWTLDKEPAPGESLRFGFNATDSHYPLVCISDTSTRVSKSDPTFVMENFCCLSHIAIS